MASGCAVGVLPCILVLFVLLSWLKHDLSTPPKDGSHTTSTPDDSSFVTPSPRRHILPTTQTVRFEDPPAPCNDVLDIIEGAGKTPPMRLHAIAPANMHVFSAFVDNRRGMEAVIIGATLYPDPEAYTDLLCLFVDGFNVWRSAATVEHESEFAGLSANLYSLFIRCPMKSKIGPYAKVGLTFNPCDSSTVYLPLHHIPHPHHVAHSTGLELCVTPLPPLYNNGSQLVEFVELHRHMGVTHFNFYAPGDISPNVKMLLDSYVADGIASAIAWNNPLSSAPLHGDAVAMQDCLYRRMNYHHPYLGFLSVNEGIFPASNPFNHSLAALVRSALSKELGRAAIRIRHHHPSSGAHSFKSQPRSQWIVRSHLVLSMQAHWVGSYFRGVGHEVPARHALVRPLEQWSDGALRSELVFRVARDAALRKKR